jgi:hypothetical protein
MAESTSGYLFFSALVRSAREDWAPVAWKASLHLEPGGLE